MTILHRAARMIRQVRPGAVSQQHLRMARGPFALCGMATALASDSSCYPSPRPFSAASSSTPLLGTMDMVRDKVYALHSPQR